MASRKQEELEIIVKTYDLMKWCCEHTSKFPRNYRFVLGERIERNLYDILEWLIAGRKRCQVPFHVSGTGVTSSIKAEQRKLPG